MRQRIISSLRKVCFSFFLCGVFSVWALEGRRNWADFQIGKVEKGKPKIDLLLINYEGSLAQETLKKDVD